MDFQCKAQARMVEILAQKLGTSHTLIIYPAHREDCHVGTGAEYTIRTNRIKAAVENCLNPGEGSDPWQGSFAFWNEWRKGNKNKDGDFWITTEEQKAYMEEVGEGLE